jgi:oligopeptide/dipeptide ABC transporter ATP-binding protein
MAVVRPVADQAVPLVEVRSLQKHYPVRRSLIDMISTRGAPRVVRAVDGVSFEIPRGASVGLAGESGCGKTTTARLLLKLMDPTGGTIWFDGKDITGLKGEALKAFRRKVQLMSQNPFEAINPRFTVLRAVMEPLLVHGIGSVEEQEQRALQALERVNLRPVEMFADSYPAHLSGGQLQRVVLARALVLEPEFLIADEPVSMLDVSIRAGVLNLMRELSASLGFTTLYISHDLSLIKYLCNYTGIMYLGSMVEWGPTDTVIENPQHPYTRALISAVPLPDPDMESLPLQIADMPSDAVNIGLGCRFANRCPVAIDLCHQVPPPEVEVGPGHRVACHLALIED